MKLPDRLEKILEMTPPCSTAADIGCDHAYVAIELVRRGKAEHAIACDVRSGPLAHAKQNVEHAGVSQSVSLRLGNGLQPVQAGECQVVILAGMGGELMKEILRDRLQDFPYFVISPHSDLAAVRKFLLENHMEIQREAMLREEGHFYTILLASSGADQETKNEEPWTEEELCFGRLLLREKDPVLKEFLEAEKLRYEGILRKTEEESVRKGYQLVLRGMERLERLESEGNDGFSGTGGRK